MVDEFVDPKTKIRLSKDKKDNLYYQKGEQRIVYNNHNGTYDFVSNGNLKSERDFFDSKYLQNISRRLTLQDTYEKWRDDTFPENLVLLENLGDLSCKKMLLLGNGTSFKELYFLHHRAEIVYTDLSLAAVNYMKDLYSLSELKEKGHGNIEFHAVDALHLPFPDA